MIVRASTRRVRELRPCRDGLDTQVRDDQKRSVQNEEIHFGERGDRPQAGRGDPAAGFHDKKDGRRRALAAFYEGAFASMRLVAIRDGAGCFFSDF